MEEILIASMTHSKSRSVNGEPDPNILWIAVNRWTMKPRFIKTMRISTTGLQKAQYEHPGFMRDPRGNGKLLLSKERRPILDWPQLPKVLSSKVKAWAPGKYQSPLNPHIKLEDQFESNPKDDGDDEQPLPAEVEVIIKDERDQRHTRTILYPTTSYTRQPLCSGALTVSHFGNSQASQLTSSVSQWWLDAPRLAADATDANCSGLGNPDTAIVCKMRASGMELCRR